MDVSQMVSFHKQKAAALGPSLFCACPSREASAFGVIEVDQEGAHDWL